MLAPLAALAERAPVAIEGVMHLGKGAQRPALYRALGSVAFVAAARIVLAVAPHPDDETRRVLAPVKANVCAPSAVLSFSLSSGRLEWDAGEPVTGLDVDALLSTGTGDRQERRAADDWLREVLEAGPVAVRDLPEGHDERRPQLAHGRAREVPVGSGGLPGRLRGRRALVLAATKHRQRLKDRHSRSSGGL